MDKGFLRPSLLSYLLFLTFIFSCTKSGPDLQLIEGKWDVVYAIRNDKATTTLEDAFFDFRSDTTFVTNIFSGEQEYRYQIQDNGIMQIGEPEVFYSISEMSNDTLILTTTINNYNFLLVTVRDTTATSLEEIE